MGQYFRQDFITSSDGAKLYFQVHGDGEPAIVLCDGLGCDGFAWKYLLPELRAHHRVLRWHYRGHGKSTCLDGRDAIAMNTHCEDLESIMRSIGLQRALVFGHSMGVQVALEFHRRFPSRAMGLVLLCGSYGNPLDTFHDTTLLKTALPFLRRAVERYPRLSRLVTRIALSTELAVQLALFLEANRQLMRRDDFLPYFHHLARMDPLVFLRTLQSVAEHSAWDHLPHIDVPTLIIGGEQDKFTPVWLSRRMAHAIPGAELTLIPAGTHTAPLEHPELIRQRVMAFLQRQMRSHAE